ncbi:MAG: YegP family protein [Gallionella sp.]|nr:YegP family protein [Gallionella sp.]
MSGYFVLNKNSNSQYHFVLKADNHETILTSEVYESKLSAQGGIASVRNNSPIDARYEKKTSIKGQPFFVLKASNGQVIGASQMYSSVAARDSGISSVKLNGSTTKIVDNS